MRLIYPTHFDVAKLCAISQLSNYVDIVSEIQWKWKFELYGNVALEV